MREGGERGDRDSIRGPHGYLRVGVGVGVADGVTVYVDHVGVGVISVTVVRTSEVG